MCRLFPPSLRKLSRLQKGHVMGIDAIVVPKTEESEFWVLFGAICGTFRASL